MQAIRNRKLPSQQVLQVDHFYGAGMIGQKNQRKACFRLAIAIDAETAAAFPPEVGAPEALTGDLLTRAVLKAIESGGFLPFEVHVREPEFRVILGALAKALGFRVKVADSLPALDFAKEHLLGMMGDSGPLQ